MWVDQMESESSENEKADTIFCMSKSNLMLSSVKISGALSWGDLGTVAIINCINFHSKVKKTTDKQKILHVLNVKKKYLVI